ncbi:MAG: tRNA (adenosine(37)-N6)-threonylcarbamoyltransferase complex dimerization subunit type 1 TsaB [Candidatus Hydrogenedentes bacterium]|nr:tRNA (adenosine(37)-N6)-threonylcarbamoyltransferase complex dimerization subunit type 1 TsaB [Candidatus Hydrogenedentota bacterium]
MKILAVDTSTSINTVAACDAGVVLAETVVACGRSHSERLLDTVDWVLGQAGLQLGEFDALAVSVGPGSFTGLRVGVATWKGLAAGAGLGLVGVPTLDAMTRVACLDDAVVCVLLDARMKEVFGAVYEFQAGVRTKRGPESVAPVEQLLDGLPDRVLFLGDGALLYRDRIEERVAEPVFAPSMLMVPRAAAVAAEAEALIAAGAPAEAARVAPVYLRKSQAELAAAEAGPRHEAGSP